jgi:hypothetical protein
LTEPALRRRIEAVRDPGMVRFSLYYIDRY